MKRIIIALVLVGFVSLGCVACDQASTTTKSTGPLGGSSTTTKSTSSSSTP